MCIVVLPMFGSVVCNFSHDALNLDPVCFVCNIVFFEHLLLYKKYLTYYTHIEPNALIVNYIWTLSLLSGQQAKGYHLQDTFFHFSSDEVSTIKIGKWIYAFHHWQLCHRFLDKRTAPSNDCGIDKK